MGLALAHSTMSFSEFAEQAGLSPMTRRGFEMHVRREVGEFNLRTERGWQVLLSEYRSVDRRRKP